MIDNDRFLFVQREYADSELLDFEKCPYGPIIEELPQVVPHYREFIFGQRSTIRCPWCKKSFPANRIVVHEEDWKNNPCNICYARFVARKFIWKREQHAILCTPGPEQSAHPAMSKSLLLGHISKKAYRNAVFPFLTMHLDDMVMARTEMKNKNAAIELIRGGQVQVEGNVITEPERPLAQDVLLTIFGRNYLGIPPDLPMDEERFWSIQSKWKQQESKKASEDGGCMRTDRDKLATYYCEVCCMQLHSFHEIDTHNLSKKHLRRLATINVIDKRSKLYCEVCKLGFTGLHPYKQHMNGKRHMKNLRSRAEYDDYCQSNNKVSHYDDKARYDDAAHYDDEAKEHTHVIEDNILQAPSDPGIYKTSSKRERDYYFSEYQPPSVKSRIYEESAYF